LEGIYPKSYRQFVRDFHQLEPMVQQGLTIGVKAGIEKGLFLKSQPEARLDRVIFDHTEADIRLQRVHAGVVETFRPWVSLLIDSATRMILAATITEGDGVGGDPNTESLVALMATAIRGHDAADGTFVGGVPRMVQCDNAKAHLAEALSTAPFVGAFAVFHVPSLPASALPVVGTRFCRLYPNFLLIAETMDGRFAAASPTTRAAPTWRSGTQRWAT
jgi:hypothetical protein